MIRKDVAALTNSLIKRILILCFGLFIMAFGVAFSIKAALGTSPISSLPYVISLISPLTVGTATIAMHCVLITLQIVLLRKHYQLLQLAQLPIAFLFGYMTDFAVWAISPLQANNYFISILYCIIGILFVGIGVSLEVNARLVPLAGEGLVLAVCQAFHRQFPQTKIGFDCTLVILAVLISLFALHNIEGVREGTAAAAVFVGLTSKQVTRILFPSKHQ